MTRSVGVENLKPKDFHGLGGVLDQFATRAIHMRICNIMHKVTL